MNQFVLDPFFLAPPFPIRVSFHVVAAAYFAHHPPPPLEHTKRKKTEGGANRSFIKKKNKREDPASPLLDGELVRRPSVGTRKEREGKIIIKR